MEGERERILEHEAHAEKVIAGEIEERGGLPPVVYEEPYEYESPGVRRDYSPEIAGTGAVAGLGLGLLGGAVMLLVVCAISSWGPATFADPIKAIGAMGRSFDEAPGGQLLIWGLIIHFAVAGTWGLIFGALMGRTGSSGGSIPAGIGFVAFVWLVMNWGLVPMVNPTLAHLNWGWPGMAWFFAHLFYGFVVGFTPMVVARYYPRVGPRFYRWLHAERAPGSYY